MTASLSSQENTRRLFTGARPERVGLYDSPWGRTLRKWVEQGYPTRKVTRKEKEGDREIEREVDEPVSPSDHFGFDMVGAGGWYDMMPLRGVNELVEETAEWKIVRNGAGAALKWWKNREGTPEHIDFRMTSREVWERDYRPHLLAVDRRRINLEESRRQLEKRRKDGKWAFYGTLFIWEHMRRSLGDVCMYESLLLDPAWIHDMNRVYTDHFKAHYKILLDEAGVPDGVWLAEDLGFKERLFCSPRTLEELVFPYYAEAVEFCHSYGMKVVLHTCGSTTEAMPLIAQAGFDGLNPMEVAAGNDVFDFAERYGDRLVFVGGFDKRILETHDHDLIRRRTRQFIRGMKERGARFLFGSDHSISTNTDYADFQCMVETYREEMLC